MCASLGITWGAIEMKHMWRDASCEWGNGGSMSLCYTCNTAVREGVVRSTSPVGEPWKLVG